MKIKYIGKNDKDFIYGKTYDIEFNATPRFVWIDAEGVQRTYINLTYFALDWDIIDRDVLRKTYIDDFYAKLP